MTDYLATTISSGLQELDQVATFYESWIAVTRESTVIPAKLSGTRPRPVQEVFTRRPSYQTSEGALVPRGSSSAQYVTPILLCENLSRSREGEYIH